MVNDIPKLRAITVWPRRNGKDLIALNLCIAKALQNKGLYFYMAPFYNQVRQIIWEGMDGSGKKFLDYIPSEVLGGRPTKIDMRIPLINGSQIKLCGSDNIDSIVGTNPKGIIFTEFSLHKPEAWHYLRPILSENKGWAIFNGTPRGLNHFYQLYDSVKKDGRWFTQYLTRDDTGIPSLEAIEEDRASGMPESLIQQEYYCSWTSSSEETLIPLDLIEPAIGREVDPDHVQSMPRIMGVDVAFAAKGDKAVIARRQGALLHPLEKYQGLDNMSLASRVAYQIVNWRADAVFIDAGRGEGVISRLIQLGHGEKIFPIHFGGRTFSDLYHRKKDEIWCKMKLWVADPVHLCSIPEGDEELTRDMSAPMFKTNDRGFIEIESKTQLKARGYGSTDSGDAVALTFGDDVEQPYPITDELRRQGVTREMLDLIRPDNGTQTYDPMNYMDSLVQAQVQDPEGERYRYVG